MHLILASGSEGRRHLLSLLQIPFTVVPSAIDEEKIQGKNPLDTIQLRAQRKAEDVAKIITLSKNIKTNHLFEEDKEALVLSADSSVIFQNTLYGKPKDYEDAKRMLKSFSGKTHEFVTAICIIKVQKTSKGGYLTRKIAEEYDRSYITFRSLTDEEIDVYLSRTAYKKFAGSYDLLDSSQTFIVNVKGSPSNVTGLPLEILLPYLQKA